LPSGNGILLENRVGCFVADAEATARLFAAHLGNMAPGLTTTVIEGPGDAVAVDVERIGQT